MAARGGGAPQVVTNERALALTGLREFRQEAAALRTALRRYEHVLDRVCRQVERDVPLHEVMGQIGVDDLRAELVERLTRFEAARHNMRVACFQMSLGEGLSIGGVARLWGISRQLASRMVKEAAAPAHTPTTEPPQRGLGLLPPRLDAMIKPRLV
jgi:hypothetical protein